MFSKNIHRQFYRKRLNSDDPLLAAIKRREIFPESQALVALLPDNRQPISLCQASTLALAKTAIPATPATFSLINLTDCRSLHRSLAQAQSSLSGQRIFRGAAIAVIPARVMPFI
ncbi:MAG TPA: hypothetical protein PKN04_00990 [bacterium]|nr:hypothetical protein [bacterium]HOX85325.1 hypothetical protein [bacterium]HPG44484.1 hypothetical protein [bacterium]HPM97042.1 hypothetical protein [bacterium]